MMMIIIMRNDGIMVTSKMKWGMKSLLPTTLYIYIYFSTISMPTLVFWENKTHHYIYLFIFIFIY